MILLLSFSRRWFGGLKENADDIIWKVQDAAHASGFTAKMLAPGTSKIMDLIPFK